MSKQIKDTVAEEVAAIEDDPDAAVTDETTVSRPGRARSQMLSVRLSPEEADAVAGVAQASGVPVSTLIRGYILRGLSQDRDDSPQSLVDALSQDVERLRRAVG